MPTKNKTQMLVPELRFPEFREDGEWEERPLGAFLNEHKVKSDGKSEVHSVSVHKGVINQKEHLGRSFAAKDTSNYNLAHPNDVIYTKSPTGEFPYGVVKQSHLKSNVIVSPLYGVYTPITAAVGYIVDCFFESPQRAYKYLDPITQKGAKNTIQITNQGFLSGLVLLPSHPPEQQKIADCLGSLDELLAAHRRKLAALQAHKKGFLQQLFPAEGQTTPNLRFPGFEGEWVEEKLGPLTTKVGSGVTPRGGSATYKASGRPFVRSQNVGWGILILDDIAYIDDKTHQGFAATEIKVDDVLLNITGASIGRSTVANSRVAGGNVNQHVCIIRTIPEKLVPLYLCQFIISQIGQSQIDSFQAGGNRQGLNFEQVRSFLIPNPPTIEEQQKIADCLSALDSLLTAQTAQLAALQAHKKGLMQKLFPNPEAVA